jgi:hypothetical protein
MMTDDITAEQTALLFREQMEQLGELVLPKLEQFAPVSVIAFLSATLTATIIAQEKIEMERPETVRKLGLRAIAIKSLMNNYEDHIAAARADMDAHQTAQFRAIYETLIETVMDERPFDSHVIALSMAIARLLWEFDHRMTPEAQQKFGPIDPIDPEAFMIDLCQRVISGFEFLQQHPEAA